MSEPDNTAAHLPAPDLVSKRGWPRWTLEDIRDEHGSVEVELLAGDVFVRTSTGTVNLSANPDQAEALALRILAAARYRKSFS